MTQYPKFKDYMKRLFIQYALVLISFVFILFIVFMLINYESFAIKPNKVCNETVSDFLEEQYEIYYENISELSQNNIIKDFIVNKKNNENDENVFRLLYDFSNGQSIKSNFIVCDNNENIKVTNLYKANISTLVNSTDVNYIINKLNEEKDKIFAITHRTQYDNGQKSDYIFAKCIMDNDIIIGYLMFQLKETSLKDFMIDTHADIVIITDNFDNVIYSNNSNIIEFTGKYKLDINSNNITHINGKSYYTVINSKLNNNINIITMTSIYMQQQFLIFGIIIICVIGFLVVILVFFLANKMTNKNIKVVNTLLETINECVNENLQYRINLDTFEEFKMLYNEFNNMITKVQYLIDKNKEISERKRIMEIKHLEGQLNPHFVFNVLDTLRYQILIDPQQASKMLVSFAKLMRYSINYGSNEVELQTDIEYVKNYLIIQKVRYNSRLDYCIDINKEVIHCKIPKLIMQTIVENCLVHGMKDSDCLTINIKGWIVENKIELTIEDNGQGIKESDMEKLLNILNCEDAMPEHIGLYNVNKAIKLLYGDIYGLDIYSKYKFGTKVILKIPITEGENTV